MTGVSDHWLIPLDNKPSLVMASVGVHGHFPVERFRLNGLWIVHMYYAPADLFLNGRRFSIDAGCACVVAPGVDMEYHFHTPEWTDRYAYFTLPPQVGRAVSVPIVQNLGSDFHAINRQFERAAACLRSRPSWSEAKIWDILWELVDRAAPADGDPGAYHPALQRTLENIEVRLSESITAAQLAEVSGISYPHLAHLFQKTLGTTISRYIRRRRIERAQQMLRYSSLSIKAIAAQVGFQDLHVFNKTVHKELGKSPSAVRAASGGDVWQDTVALY